MKKLMFFSLFVFLMGQITQAQLSKKSTTFYYEITSDGYAKEKIVKTLKEKGFQIDRFTLPALKNLQTDSVAGKKYKLVIIKGGEINYTRTAKFEGYLGPNDSLIEINFPECIIKFGTEKGYKIPTPDIAYMIGKLISGKEMKEMGVSLLVIVNEIRDSASYDLPFVFAMNGGKHNKEHFPLFSRRSFSIIPSFVFFRDLININDDRIGYVFLASN